MAVKTKQNIWFHQDQYFTVILRFMRVKRLNPARFLVIWNCIPPSKKRPQTLAKSTTNLRSGCNEDTSRETITSATNVGDQTTLFAAPQLVKITPDSFVLMIVTCASILSCPVYRHLYPFKLIFLRPVLFHSHWQFIMVLSLSKPMKTRALFNCFWTILMMKPNKTVKLKSFDTYFYSSTDARRLQRCLRSCYRGGPQLREIWATSRVGTW